MKVYKHRELRLVSLAGNWKNDKLPILWRNHKHWHGTVRVLVSAGSVAFGKCTSGKVWKIQFLTRVCNYLPLPTMHVVGLRMYDGKSLAGMSWNLIWRKVTKVPMLEYQNTIDIMLQIIFFYFLDILSKNAKLVSRSGRHWLFHNNMISTVS